MVLGYARHGKDTVCDILHQDYGLTFESSSHFVAERAVRPWLAARGITYSSFDDMYADRVNHRSDWFDAICAYNEADPARLGKELYATYDIYCGIRNIVEFEALKAQGVIDCTLWVDASQRVPPESANSMTITPAQADCVIDNNGPVEVLRPNVAAAYTAALEQMRSGSVH